MIPQIPITCPNGARPGCVCVCLGVGQVRSVGNLGGDAGAPVHALFTPAP